MALLDLGTSRAVGRPLRTSLMARLALWRSRRQLAKLDARALEDIGISQADADNEARLGVWDVPPSWVNR